MPQLFQLPTVVWSQFLWLAVGLGFIFFVIARGMMPKIQATVEAREQKIASELESAQRARDQADRTESAWRERMDAARSEALKLAGEAKQKGAVETEKKVKAADSKLAGKIAESEATIRQALESARRELEAIAAEATQEAVSRLTGVAIDRKDADAAVKGELHG